MSFFKNAVSLSHDIAEKVLKSGDIAVDATCGKGNDTLFLSRLVGKTGRVYGFDVQQAAIFATRTLLEQNEAKDNTTLILDGHETMERYIQTEIQLAMFNFGYLPGGDHQKATKPETSIAAVGAAMRLLCHGGLITLCIYSGGDTGFAERDALLAFCETINPKEFSVLSFRFLNQENHPPMLVVIEKK